MPRTNGTNTTRASRVRKFRSDGIPLRARDLEDAKEKTLLLSKDHVSPSIRAQAENDCVRMKGYSEFKLRREITKRKNELNELKKTVNDVLNMQELLNVRRNIQRRFWRLHLLKKELRRRAKDFNSDDDANEVVEFAEYTPPQSPAPVSVPAPAPNASDFSLSLANVDDNALESICFELFADMFDFDTETPSPVPFECNPDELINFTAEDLACLFD